MKYIYLFFFLAITLFSCGQNRTANRATSVASLSNKVIPLVNHLDNADSCIQALRYLDSASNLDKDCFSCYQNKLMFLNALQQFDKAIVALNECIRLQPKAHDLYLTGGMLYERIGDTLTAASYFQQSMQLLTPVLDTMKANHPDYDLLLTHKAVNLIMLGDAVTGNALLKEVASRQQEPESQQAVLQFVHRSKKELVELFTKRH